MDLFLYLLRQTFDAQLLVRFFCRSFFCGSSVLYILFHPRMPVAVGWFRLGSGSLLVVTVTGGHTQYMGRWKTPQIIHLNRRFHYKPSILGYPYFLETSILWICSDLFCILGFLGAIWDPYDARQPQIAGDGLVGECKPEQ